MLGEVTVNILVEDPETARSMLALLYDSVRMKEPDKAPEDQVGPSQGPSEPTH